MKKIILSLAIVSTICSLGSFSKKTHADTTNLTYENNAYQVWMEQNNLNNLFLGNSIYNFSPTSIRLKNSIKFKANSEKTITIYLKFKENLNLFNCSPDGIFNLTLLGDDNTELFSFNHRFQTLNELSDIIGTNQNTLIFNNDNELAIQLKYEQDLEFITICGDEYTNSQKHFNINFGQNNAKIERFMLFTNDYQVLNYAPPTLGLGSHSNQVYSNDDIINYVVNYDDRIPLEEITKNIIAFDYVDNAELETTIITDEYTTAVNDNLLGVFPVKISATDKTGNQSIITLNLNIQDLTPPEIKGKSYIEVEYTDLLEGNKIDLSKYYYGSDNYDRVITLSEEYQNYSPIMFERQNVTLKISDSSGNVSEKTIILNITDSTSPILKGPNKISIYQYEYENLNDVLPQYTIYDEGSGVEEITVTSGDLKDLGKPGTYNLAIKVVDKIGNANIKYIELIIKDGVGPVFFINTSTLSLAQDNFATAGEVITKLIEKGEIRQIRYKRCEYISTEYQQNYTKLGTYDTQIICYDEEGNKDYYLVKLKVEKARSSNIFTSFYSSMMNFFNSLFEQVKKLFNEIKTFFTK